MLQELETLFPPLEGERDPFLSWDLASGVDLPRWPSSIDETSLGDSALDKYMLLDEILSTGSGDASAWQRKDVQRQPEVCAHEQICDTFYCCNHPYGRSDLQTDTEKALKSISGCSCHNAEHQHSDIGSHSVLSLSWACLPSLLMLICCAAGLCGRMHQALPSLVKLQAGGFG